MMKKPLVSVDWLYQNLDNPNLVILDTTMRKITWEDNEFRGLQLQIKSARCLDIKNTFSDTSSRFPNMMLTPEKFQEETQKIGINKDSIIVVYDTIGIYTSPRVWWMFKSMGHHNIAILDGGLKEWTKAGYSTVKAREFTGVKGDFISTYDQNYFCKKQSVLRSISDKNTTILDARSEDRFDGTRAEPRKGLRSGHIPSSKNLHYADLLAGNKMKSKEELIKIFSSKVEESNSVNFSCGSGITACILVLGAEMIGYKNLSVYDGSWTEWGSFVELPIEK